MLQLLMFKNKCEMSESNSNKQPSRSTPALMRLGGMCVSESAHEKGNSSLMVTEEPLIRLT